MGTIRLLVRQIQGTMLSQMTSNFPLVFKGKLMEIIKLCCEAVPNGAFQKIRASENGKTHWMNQRKIS